MVLRVRIMFCLFIGGSTDAMFAFFIVGVVLLRFYLGVLSVTFLCLVSCFSIMLMFSSGLSPGELLSCGIDTVCTSGICFVSCYHTESYRASISASIG